MNEDEDGALVLLSALAALFQVKATRLFNYQWRRVNTVYASIFLPCHILPGCNPNTLHFGRVPSQYLLGRSTNSQTWSRSRNISLGEWAHQSLRWGIPIDSCHFMLVLVNRCAISPCGLSTHWKSRARMSIPYNSNSTVYGRGSSSWMCACHWPFSIDSIQPSSFAKFGNDATKQNQIICETLFLIGLVLPVSKFQWRTIKNAVNYFCTFVLIPFNVLASFWFKKNWLSRSIWDYYFTCVIQKWIWILFSCIHVYICNFTYTNVAVFFLFVRSQSSFKRSEWRFTFLSACFSPVPKRFCQSIHALVRFGSSASK